MEIYTIGHSTRSLENFISLLKSFQIDCLVDVRHFPGSRRYPHFNKESLALTLADNEIEYLHFPDLGGRRKPNPQSTNTAWRNASFKGYADHMQTQKFLEAINILMAQAMKIRTAYMCSEAVWWRCHRALISDFLKARHWKVIHIMDKAKGEEHPYTSPANVVQGNLFYD